MMFKMSAGEFDLVYNSLSFTLASMMASTLFFWLRLSSVHEKYKTAMTVTGLVTFIAAYHYLRIFNSWVDAYEFPAAAGDGDSIAIHDPVLTGKPFNDAYRYMDWLLTVPLLLIEIIFCCNLSPDETAKKAWALGVSSGLMIILGYPGELIIEGDMGVRFMFWFAAMIPFLYVVYTLLVGLKEAIAFAGLDKGDVIRLFDTFCEIDADNTGTVTLAQFNDHCGTPSNVRRRTSI